MHFTYLESHFPQPVMQYLYTPTKACLGFLVLSSQNHPYWRIENESSSMVLHPGSQIFVYTLDQSLLHVDHRYAFASVISGAILVISIHLRLVQKLLIHHLISPRHLGSRPLRCSGTLRCWITHAHDTMANRQLQRISSIPRMFGEEN
jgi:hypothetical protein